MGCCGGLPRRALPSGRCGVCLLALGAVQMSYLLAPSFLPEQLLETPVPSGPGEAAAAAPPPGGAAAPEGAAGSALPADAAPEVAHTVFRGVALLVHCRASAEVCGLRAPLLDGYRRFFSTVRHMLPKNRGRRLPSGPRTCAPAAWAIRSCAWPRC
ncbi:unnamed protein product [Prorocentrum cordatum]|uniref:Uncharacterized protein n=1 Tax=Prorocentrum cordatum TaxID=2364126 RepID=A0ABN9W8A3_9DINO|nr:unnamed protein product [Polarella glacialis]